MRDGGGGAGRRLWPLLYVALACVPLAIALLPPRPPGRSFWIELSVALGFIGLAMMALEFALVARFQRLSRPFGIDLVMQYHRQVGLLAAALVLAHPLVLGIERAGFLALLSPFAGTAASRAGAWSLLALLLLVATTLLRKRLRLRYEPWRLLHGLLGVAAVGLALLHVALAGSYVTPGGVAAPPAAAAASTGSWKLPALVLFCATCVGLLAALRLVKPWLLARRPYEVVGVQPDVAETWVLTLAPVGHRGMEFEPGQFAWVRIGVSPWSLREHPFSFSSSAARRDRVEFAIKELGDFTRTIGGVRPGTRVYLDGPHGSFTCDRHPADGYVFVAGGIGVTPMLSMLETLADRGDVRPHALVDAASAWERLAFKGRLERLQQRLRLTVACVLERPHEGWEGEVGHVSPSLLARLLPADGLVRHVFLCGPDAMLSAVEAHLRALGVPPDRIHIERFDLA